MTDAAVFKALADDLRLQIIGLLCNGEGMSGKEIWGRMSGRYSQSNISHDLRMLKSAGVVSCEHKGKFRIYRLNKDFMLSFLHKAIGQMKG